MMNNVPGQRHTADANARAANQASAHYTLLTQMAELDVELAWSASAVGIAAHLLSADDIALHSSPFQANPSKQS